MANLSDNELKAANNQKILAQSDAASVEKQLKRQLKNYDAADARNRNLADLELIQASRDAGADRFEAQRDLQNAALGVMGSMNQAFNGSSLGNLQYMLENRNDKENATYWNQYQKNADTINNAWNESKNANDAARADALANAEAQIGAIESSYAANLNNLDPDLFVKPGTGEADLGSNDVVDKNRTSRANSSVAGYVMPDNARQNINPSTTNQSLAGNDYFSRLLKGFNRR